MEDHMLARLTAAITAAGDTLPTITTVLGVLLLGAGLCALRTQRVPIGLASCLVAFLTMGFSAFTDALSRSLFEEEARLMRSVDTPPLLEPYWNFAIALVVFVGSVSIIKGLLWLRRLGKGEDEALWPGLTHLVAGVFCVNIVALAKALAHQAGGALEALILAFFS